MNTQRVLKSKESSSDTEDSELESEEKIKKSRIKSSTEDEDSEVEKENPADSRRFPKCEVPMKKEAGEDLQSKIKEEDRTEDPDVNREVNLKTNDKSLNTVKIENDEDTDACFSSDEEDQKSSQEEKSQKPEVKNEPDTSTKNFESKIENQDSKTSSDEDEPVRKKKREINESSKKRKLEDSSSEDDQPVKRKKSSSKKISKNHGRRKALESSEDEEFAEDDNTFDEDEVEVKPPPKTCVIDEGKTEEISKIFEKIRRKWKKLGKNDKSFYLRFKIQKPLDLPNDQQCKLNF